MYREQKITHGGYMTVSLYPVFRTGRKRRGRYRATSEVQQRLNEFNARERLGQQLDLNFRDGDGFWVLTYDDEHIPQTRAAHIRAWQAYKKRLLRFAKREGLDEVKLAAVTHGDAGGNRLHIHVVVSGDIPAATMARIWGNGYVEVRPLRAGHVGYRGLAEYMMRGMEWGRVMTTRNLTQPERTERTGRISAAAVETISDAWDDRAAYAGIWPGYEIVDVRPFFNWYNKHYYLRIYARACGGT